MAKLKNFNVVREKWLKDYEVKKEYDTLSTEFQIAAEIIKARTKAKMTQAELAERLGTKPTAISRIESPNYGKVSISTLKKIAQTLDCELQIRFLPKKMSHVNGLLPKPIHSCIWSGRCSRREHCVSSGEPS